jgi:hypothetical protein
MWRVHGVHLSGLSAHHQDAVCNSSDIAQTFNRPQEWYSSGAYFHCWIESDGKVIDLMAPLFHESVRSAGRTESVARKMFQRPTVAMAQSPYELEKEGDFFLQPDPVLGVSLLNGFMSKLANGDLVKVCEYWYRPLPKAMQSTIQMGSDDGSIREIQLNPVSLVGAW